MAGFVKVDPVAFQCSPFNLIGKDWMLIAAEKAGKVNAMTAAWGGLGTMWAKSVAFIVIRPERYTHEFVEASERLSLNFFAPSFKKQLGYFGAVSGRDEDKIAKTGLTVEHADGAPYFGEASLVMTCRKMYAQRYQRECFVDTDQDKEWYDGSHGGYHTLYIAEIMGIYNKK